MSIILDKNRVDWLRGVNRRYTDPVTGTLPELTAKPRKGSTSNEAAMQPFKGFQVVIKRSGTVGASSGGHCW